MVFLTTFDCRRLHQKQTQKMAVLPQGTEILGTSVSSIAMMSSSFKSLLYDTAIVSAEQADRGGCVGTCRIIFLRVAFRDNQYLRKKKERMFRCLDIESRNNLALGPIIPLSCPHTRGWCGHHRVRSPFFSQLQKKPDTNFHSRADGEAPARLEPPDSL